jgi:hypothetical protein
VEVTPWQVEEANRNIRGKFLITYNDHPDVRQAFEGYYILPVVTREEMGRYIPATGEKRMSRPFPQLLIANYELETHD